MVLSFLIATLVLSIINIVFSLVMLGISISNQNVNKYSIINIFIALTMMTWNIFAIAFL